MTAPLMLTEMERERFATWLEQEARTADGLIEQMIKTQMPEMVIRTFKVQAGPARVIARNLRNTETQTLGGPGDV